MRIVLPLVLVLVLAAVAVSPMAFAQFQSGGVDKDGSWYVSENLLLGDYFSYDICHIEYKECREFSFRVWFNGFVQVGSEEQWTADVVVRDGNKVIVGNMTLGKLNAEPTSSSPDLNKYRQAFKSSVVWLSAFTSANSTVDGDGPKPFKDISWGKIANIGGEQVRPVSIEDVTVPAGTWEETVVISWRTGGAVSKIWVADGFPFPVKAHTFTHVPEGIAPPEYIFSLIDYDNYEETPFEGIISTAKEPRSSECDTDIQKTELIKKATDKFTYQVHVAYGPEDPAEGCDMEWLIKFIKKEDDTEILNQVQFDVLVLDEKGELERSIAHEEGIPFLYSPSGIYDLDLRLKEPAGQVTYTIFIYGLSPDWIVPDAAGYDRLDIPITIFPEKSVSIPDWIKKTAGHWVDGDIDDASFASAIQFLVNEGIIQIPPTTSEKSPEAAPIPEWIKMTAGHWVDGDIDDASFASAIQFLIREGIIVIG